MAWFPKAAFDFDERLKDRWTNQITTDSKIWGKQNIVYDPADETTCVLDLLCPEDRKDKMPVLLNIHGGGWVTGDKYSRRGVCTSYADMGLFVVNINYGICPQYKYHESVQHVYTAFNWIYKNADEYGFDLDNVFVTGDSAGAQLACLLLATQNNRHFKSLLNIEETPIRARSGVLNCGAYDFEKILSNPMAYWIVRDMTGQTPYKVKDYEYHSLLHAIDWIDQDFPDNVFIVYGRFDTVVGGHEKTLMKKLNSFGKNYHVYRAKGLGEHCFHLWPNRPISRIYFAAVRQYFDQMLSGSEVKLTL